MASLAQALKLIALDREGLGVISAHIQDTCVKRVDMTWLPQQRRFLVAGMRDDWVGGETRPDERLRRLELSSSPSPMARWCVSTSSASRSSCATWATAFPPRPAPATL